MAYETITVTSGTLTATAYLQPNLVYGDGKTTATYMVKTGFGRALLLHFAGGTAYSGLGYYNFSGSSVKVGRCYDTVTLAFSDSIAYPFPGINGGTAGETYGTSTTGQTGYSEIPLEILPNYRMCWNYDLYEFVATGGTAGATPMWWSTATTTAKATGTPKDGEYLWSKTTPVAAEGGEWKLIEPRTKPGIDVKRKYYPVITVTEYFPDEQSAYDAMLEVGWVATPTAGWASLAASWLVTNCSVAPLDGGYSVTTEYTGSELAWDYDLYDLGAIVPNP